MSDDDLPVRQLFLIVPKRCRHVFENKYMIGEQPVIPANSLIETRFVTRKSLGCI
jgi:hypothetical protein